MAHVTIEHGIVTVTMQGLDKSLAVRGHLSVPLTHMRGITVRPDEACAIVHGVKRGTNLPGVVTAGTFITAEGQVFYDVHVPAHRRPRPGGGDVPAPDHRDPCLQRRGRSSDVLIHATEGSWRRWFRENAMAVSPRGPRALPPGTPSPTQLPASSAVSR